MESGSDDTITGRPTRLVRNREPYLQSQKRENEGQKSTIRVEIKPSQRGEKKTRGLFFCSLSRSLLDKILDAW